MKQLLPVKIILLCSILFVFSSTKVEAQQLPSIEVIQSMSDQQLQNYWLKLQQQGYSIDQLEQMARIEGLSEIDIQKLRGRLNSLNTSVESSTKTSDKLLKEIESNFGIKNADEIEVKMENDELAIFGTDFFNNPSINLEPNLNIAVSDSYQLGPGDELSIDVWGAAQKSYVVTVNKEGRVLLENLAPIYINGLSLKQAAAKIKTKLSLIYAGIGKEVGADVYLSKARTIVINIVGNVSTPGTYSIVSLSTPINALYAAGGPNPKGSFRNIKLIRNGRTIATVDIYDFLIKGINKQIFMQDNDVLMIPPFESQISLKGAAKTNAVYELKESENVNDLLKYAGGFTSNAFKTTLYVERIEGINKKMVSINSDNFSKAALQDGDIVEVKFVTDRFTNKVSIGGEVKIPGAFPLESTQTLRDLLLATQGFTEEALLTRGLMYRTFNGVETKVESFNVKKVMGGEVNFDLQPDDRVEILSNAIINNITKIKISGLVANPGDFKFYENLTVGDAIALAGGLKYEAENSSVDVFRNTFASGNENISLKISNGIKADFSNVSEDLILKPNDIIVVRQKKGYFSQESFTVSGLVSKPGLYVLTKSRYTLFDALNDSGGLLEDAFVDGIFIKRKNVVEESLEDVAEEQAEEIGDFEFQDYLIVSANVTELINSNGSEKYDVELFPGDEIIVPKYNSTITIDGAVQQPTSIGFSKNLSFRSAVNAAGGYSENAKKSKAYVFYPNGRMKTKKHFLFLTFNPKLSPGSTIIVPEKNENNNKMSAQEILGITSGISTLGVLIRTLIGQ